MRLITMNARRSGKTRGICMAAKAIGATVICASERHAKQLRDLYGVKAITMENQERQRVGSEGSFIWDHFAADLAVDRAADTIEALQKKYRSSRDEVTRLRRKLKDAGEEGCHGDQEEAGEEDGEGTAV